MNKDLKNRTISELKQTVEELGGKNYLAKYIFSFIHQQDVDDIDLISTLSKQFRQKLNDNGFYISSLKITDKLTDPDGTVKYLLETEDGGTIESVLLKETNRQTICLSSQIGCRLGCKFCATGYLKFKRSLTAAEIADQVNIICRDSQCKINNVVFMGMGEPFKNYDNVLKAVRILSDPSGKNIGIRRQTLSTVGIISGIKKLADEDIFPRLAVSLHAPDDAVRKLIVPAANKYPFEKLIKALKYYTQTTGRRVTIEYCMMDKINDNKEYAKKLAQQLRDIKANVNLIEYNPHNGCDFRASNRGKIKLFKDALMKLGIETIIRYRRGTNIKAACGQLGADRITNSN